MAAWLSRLSKSTKSDDLVAEPASELSSKVDPDVKQANIAAAGSATKDENALSLLKCIMEATKELGEIKPWQMAMSTYFLLNHPEISQAVEEAVQDDPTVTLPMDMDAVCRIGVASYATNLKQLLSSVGPSYASTAILYAQYATVGLNPAHMFVRDETTNRIYLTIRGTAGIVDAIKDLAGSSRSFLDSRAHSGMVAAANSFFTQKYQQQVWSKCKALEASGPSAGLPSAGRGYSPGPPAASNTNMDAVTDAAPGHAGDMPLPPASLKDGGDSAALDDASGLPNIVNALLRLFPGSEFIITGHSLGAGTGALVCCRLRATLHRVQEIQELGSTDSVGASTVIAALERIPACKDHVRACLFATPACASPELSLVTQRCVDGALHPIVQNIVLADDVVPRLTVSSVKALHSKLAHPLVSAAANSEAYNAAVQASTAAVAKLWDNVTGGPAGKLQTTSRMLYDNLSSGVSTFAEKPAVVQAAAVVSSGITSALRKWHGGATPKEMSAAYNLVAPDAVVSDSDPLTIRGCSTNTPPPELESGQSPVDELLSPWLTPELRAISENYRKEACGRSQHLVVPGFVYHITRIATTLSPKEEDGARAISGPIHDSLVANVAAAEVVASEALTDSDEVVKQVEDRLLAGDFRVHLVPPIRLSKIRVSRTMVDDHSKKRYLATVEALCLIPGETKAA